MHDNGRDLLKLNTNLNIIFLNAERLQPECPEDSSVTKFFKLINYTTGLLPVRDSLTQSTNYLCCTKHC